MAVGTQCSVSIDILFNVPDVTDSSFPVGTEYSVPVVIECSVPTSIE